MPVFSAHIPAQRFTANQKRALADALNQSLVQGWGVPEEDRFITISEHNEAELFIHPTFPSMQRSDAAMIINVLIGSQRTVEDKKNLAATISRLVSAALDVSPDDVFIAMTPIPLDGFSFGRGELMLADGQPRW